MNIQFPIQGQSPQASQSTLSATVANEKPIGGSANGTSEPTAQVAKDSREMLDTAVASMQNFAQSISRDLDFSVDDSSGRVVVQVIASDSGKLIRQIPSEEALRLAEHLDEIRSLLLKDQA